MENASKALIMAGGILIAILIVSVLIFAWNLFSDYQSSRDSLSDIEDTAKFNLQFTNYDRDDVLGYELLSLLNQIVDYNERKSEDNSKYGNDEKYPAVSITIKIGDPDVVVAEHFSYDNKPHLFQQQVYYDDALTATDTPNRNKSNSFQAKINVEIQNIQSELGNINEGTLASMAKNIRAIFKTEEEIIKEAGLDSVPEVELNTEENQTKMNNIKKLMINKFNSYVSDDYKIDMGQIEGLILKSDRSGVKNRSFDSITTMGGKTIHDLYEMICSYYEYMQFKRGIFKCTELDYDQPTGRVNKVVFEFTKKVK